MIRIYNDTLVINTFRTIEILLRPAGQRLVMFCRVNNVGIIYFRKKKHTSEIKYLGFGFETNISVLLESSAIALYSTFFSFL